MAVNVDATNIVERAVNTALEDIEKYAPKEFKEILQADSVKKEEFKKAAKKAAEEEVKLAVVFSPKDERTAEDIHELLRIHYSADRLELIKTGLQVPTYRLEIVMKPDGYNWVHRNTTLEMEASLAIPQESFASTNTTKWMWMASTVVEAILLVLPGMGIQVQVSESMIHKMVEEVTAVIKQFSALQKSVLGLKEAVESGLKWKIAKAIFYLIKESYSAGILWEIIKGLCSNMSPWDLIISAGIVSAMIATNLDTDGAALIAKIVLALNFAYEFKKKWSEL